MRTRVVVRVPTWLGDAVLALPALVALRRHFAGADLTLAVAPAVAPLFQEACDLEGTATLVLPANTREQVRRLAADRIDTAILLTNSFGSAWVLWRAGARERWGYAARWRRPLLTRAVRRPRGRVHQAEYYRRLVEELGIPAPSALPRVRLEAATHRRAADLLERAGWDGARPLVGLAPGAAYGHAKRWPPARFAELATRLAAEQGAAVALLGATSDRDAGREIESRVGRPLARARLLNLIGQTDLRTAMGVMAACEVVVSNDSGAMHLAAALGRPVVAVFGPTDERVTGPLGGHDVLVHPVFCRPCLLRECPIDHRCMKGIPATRVFDAVVRRLGSRRPDSVTSEGGPLGSASASADARGPVRHDA